MSNPTILKLDIFKYISKCLKCLPGRYNRMIERELQIKSGLQKILNLLHLYHYLRTLTPSMSIMSNICLEMARLHQLLDSKTITCIWWHRECKFRLLR